MPSGIQLTEIAGASQNTPSASKDIVFVDNTGVLSVKNSAGNTRASDNTVYRTLAEFHFTIPAGITTGVVLPGTAGLKSGADITTATLPLYSYTAADFGNGAKFRLKCRLATNGIAPGTITFTFGLYSVTFAGAASAFVPTVGTVVTGSTAAVVNPLLSTSTDANSGDFTTTAANFTDGLAYVAGCNISATTAATTVTKGTATLQTRNT